MAFDPRLGIFRLFSDDNLPLSIHYPSLDFVSVLSKTSHNHLRAVDRFFFRLFSDDFKVLEDSEVGIRVLIGY